ncbi:hypothetical protein VCEM1676A_000427 [Vibrio cholerae O1 str. EM-1676A]|nr:hypothetical protein VCEM1676A_000427 [Vibrio cholerae O1 str. EM-1676A]
MIEDNHEYRISSDGRVWISRSAIVSDQSEILWPGTTNSQIQG